MTNVHFQPNRLPCCMDTVKMMSPNLHMPGTDEVLKRISNLTFFCACGYLSMLGLKLNHVREMGPWAHIYFHSRPVFKIFLIFWKLAVNENININIDFDIYNNSKCARAGTSIALCIYLDIYDIGSPYMHLEYMSTFGCSWVHQWTPIFMLDDGCVDYICWIYDRQWTGRILTL